MGGQGSNLKGALKCIYLLKNHGTRL